MNIQLKKVKDSEKDIVYRLLQFALYDGSLYIDNKINNNAIFDYPYFDAYFSDSTRDKYFIMVDDSLAGFVFINEYNKFNKYGKTIAEFLIMPEFRRNQIGTKAATLAFEKYPGPWEVQPMENNKAAYSFWQKVIKNYTNNDYIIKNDGVEDVFIFNNHKTK